MHSYRKELWFFTFETKQRNCLIIKNINPLFSERKRQIRHNTLIIKYDWSTLPLLYIVHESIYLYRAHKRLHIFQLRQFKIILNLLLWVIIWTLCQPSRLVADRRTDWWILAFLCSSFYCLLTRWTEWLFYNILRIIFFVIIQSLMIIVNNSLTNFDLLIHYYC